MSTAPLKPSGERDTLERAAARSAGFWEFIRTYTGNKMKPEEKMHGMMMSMQRQIAYKNVALSWWLSPPWQLYSQNNLAERNCIISLLKDGQDGRACRKQ